MSQLHAHRTGRSGHAAIEWLAVALIAIALLAVATLGGGAPHVETPATRTVSVSQGDTLWEIASNHPVAGLSTAEMVDVLTELNGLDGAFLTAGSSVIVPVEASHSEALALR